MYYLYVLRLTGNFIYVGITDNPDRRYMEHVTGRGSYVTKMYPPLYREQLMSLGVMTYGQAEQYEDYWTLYYMSQYGYQNVRGGHYVRVSNIHIYNMLKNNKKIYEFGFTPQSLGIY